MQKLANFVPAFSHHLKPLMRHGSQFTRVLLHPRIDGGIPLDGGALHNLEVLFAPEDVRCWPAGTGYALAEYLRRIMQSGSDRAKKLKLADRISNVFVPVVVVVVKRRRLEYI